jgi:hypothetical protein
VKANLVYELPFGRGRRFGGNSNGLVDRIIGGWQVGIASRIQCGRLVDLGNVRLVGMSANDVQNIFKLRFDDAGQAVWMLPQDVIDNTLKAFSVSATSATGYSTQGVPIGRYFAPPNGPRLHRAGRRRRLRRLRDAIAGRDRPDVPAARHQNLEADADRRANEHRVRRRAVERVQPPEFRPCRWARSQHRQ